MNYLIYTLSFIALVVTTISLFMYFDNKYNSALNNIIIPDAIDFDRVKEKKEKVVNRMLNLSIYLNTINWLIILANYLIN